ncbi:MAG TPA: dephospho-CoA kinase [Anaeromyxobacteraceae bacterium]|nr:dephospho-CoA kinase [Anaeromyxobacteraceae bacterium]
MRLVGLTGGIATGKSTFAEALRELGVPVVDADRLAREAVRSGSPALRRIAREFGPEALGPDGELDRGRMADLVFADAGARARLEAIVHPEVRRLLSEETARLAAAGCDLAVHEVPLLYERGPDRELDCVVVVWAPVEAQRARLAARDGLSPQQVEARLAAQMPVDEKARRADVVVENDGDLESLRAKARSLLRDLRQGLGRRLPNAPPARY